MIQLKYSLAEFSIFKSKKRYNFSFEKMLDMKTTRNKFNQIISLMTYNNNNDLLFYLLQFTEKNTLANSIFLNFCRISLLEKISKDNYITVHTNQPSIYYHFKNNIKISYIDKIIFTLVYYFNFFLSILRSCKVFVGVSYNKILFSNKKIIPSLKNSIIIQTFVSDTSFEGDRFEDFYYESLKKNMKKSHKQIITWPVFYNFNKKIKGSKFIKKNYDKFIIPENYLNWKDLIKFIPLIISFKFFKPYRIFKKSFKYYSFIKYWISIESLRKDYFYYLFIKNLSLIENKNLSFLFNHENLIPQKIPLLAIRQFLPETETYGYFHTSKPKNLLSLDYGSKKEFNIFPKPKIILFNSQYYKSFYEKKWPSLKCENVISFKMKGIDITKINPKKNRLKMSKTLC